MLAVCNGRPGAGQAPAAQTPGPPVLPRSKNAPSAPFFTEGICPLGVPRRMPRNRRRPNRPRRTPTSRRGTTRSTGGASIHHLPDESHCTWRAASRSPSKSPILCRGRHGEKLRDRPGARRGDGATGTATNCYLLRANCQIPAEPRFRRLSQKPAPKRAAPPGSRAAEEIQPAAVRVVRGAAAAVARHGVRPRRLKETAERAARRDGAAEPRIRQGRRGGHRPMAGVEFAYALDSVAVYRVSPVRVRVRRREQPVARCPAGALD